MQDTPAVRCGRGAICQTLQPELTERVPARERVLRARALPEPEPAQRGPRLVPVLRPGPGPGHSGCTLPAR